MNESNSSRATIEPEITPIAAPLKNPVSVVCPFMAPAIPPIITPPAFPQIKTKQGYISRSVINMLTKL